MVAFSVNIRTMTLLLIVIVCGFFVLKFLLPPVFNYEIMGYDDDDSLKPSDSIPLFSKSCANGILTQGWNDLKKVLLKNIGPVMEVDISNYTPDLEATIEVNSLFPDLLAEAMNSTRNDLFIIMEIGSYKGNSTVYMADECNSMAKDVRKTCIVISIDPWLGTPDAYEKESRSATQLDLFQTFYSNVRSLNLVNSIYPLRMTSSMAAHVLHCFRIPADIVFFAGDSEYELLKRDLRSYYPLLRNGGFIFGHGINSDRPGS
uniref:NYN domain-containing protein n=1 Tax=Steinernema glaseri TaxID=37863 RepID=A0A1I8AN92_9BILA